MARSHYRGLQHYSVEATAMSKYYIHNRADATLEVILPGHWTTSGYDVQLLITKSMAVDVAPYLKSPESLMAIPRVKNLVARNLAEVVVE